LKNLIEQLESLKGKKLQAFQLVFAPKVREEPLSLTLFFEDDRALRVSDPADIEIAFNILPVFGEDSHARQEKEPAH
jgi:hypothetical protein